MQRVWSVLAAVIIAGLFCPTIARAQNMDSLLVNLAAVNDSKGEDGKLQLEMQWKVFKKTFDKKKGTYSEWEEVKEIDTLNFKPQVYGDSAFTTVVAEAEAKGNTYTFKGLEFGKFMTFRVLYTGTGFEARSDAGEGKIFKNSAGETTGGNNPFVAYARFFVAGGISFMIPMHLLALFGLICIFLTWKRLLLANVFPPNKPDLMYRILPFDRLGKTDMNSDKGNIFLREVAKYWSKAMESSSVGPEHFESTDAYIKASRQQQEEIEKRLWIEIGLPNVEKAIDICRNGVPGVKLAKKPLEYGTVKVLLAALENHRSNRNNFWASQEMDRAAENTVLKELDELKGWETTAIWAISTIEPMLGLFGTVVGIRQSFIAIETTIKTNPNAQLQQIVPSLAGGIQVALITTILGLTFGIPMSLAYFYYRSKIDWIFGKWEEIITDILNQA